MSSFLEQHKRQPKVYIDLPTQGKFWKKGSLEEAINIPVFGMTAMDEIIIKTPDALFTGESTAKVIESCIPAIKDAWDMPVYDLDYCLIAVRIATYGDTMDVTTTCPHCGETTTVTINLQNLLDNFSNKNVDNTFDVENLTVKIKPVTYKIWSDNNIKEYQIRRTIMNYQKEELDSVEKEKIIKKLLTELTEMNLFIAISQIESISAGEESESDTKEIFEFVKNSDTKFYKKLLDNLQSISSEWDIPKITIKCTNEKCEKEFPSSLTMDYSNFFVA